MARTIRRKNAHNKHRFTDSWFKDYGPGDNLNYWLAKRYGGPGVTVEHAKLKQRSWYHSDAAAIRRTAPRSHRYKYTRRLRSIHKEQVYRALHHDKLDALSLRPEIPREGSWYYF